MEGFDNSRISTSFTGSNDRFEENKKRLVRLHEIRNSKNALSITGKDRGKSAWHFVLVDCDKCEQFRELIGGSADCKDFGKILESGWGSNAPEIVLNKTERLIEDLKNQLFIFRWKINKEIYYTLCDVDKRCEIVSSRTVEEIVRWGRILYFSLDEDPPEALWDVIEKGYFRLTDERHYDFRSSRIGEVRKGDVRKVREFLEEVDNVDWTDEDGWTMLHHAAHCGDLDMIRVLKDMDADTQVRDNICGRKPIHIAARECHIRALELLLVGSDSVNDTDKSGWTPLHYATWKGESNTVKYLISKKANPDIRDRYLGKKPVHVAVTEGHMDIVQIFLDNGTNIDETDASSRTLIYYAIWEGRLEMAKFLIARDANVHMAKEFEVRPIHASTECDDITMIELLLSHGSDIESQCCDGVRPLHWAAEFGSIDAVRFLVSKGADFNAVDKEGRTPFDFAAMKHLKIASFLAERMCEKFREQAMYSNAVEICAKLIKIQKQHLNQNHPETLQTLSSIATLLYEQGKYEEALKTFNSILKIRQDILGFYDLETLCTTYEIGRVYVAQWKLAEAMEIFQKVYNNWQGTFGVYHQRTLSVYREIAYVHFKNVEYEEALKIFEDIFVKRKLSLGIDNAITLQAWQDMAIVLINIGENTKALQILTDILEKRKILLGAHHPDTISTGHHITTVSKRLNNAVKKSYCWIS